jgi:DNA repair protein RecO (recombination protein O)
MLRLPAFLRDEQIDALANDELSAAFALTGFFLERHVFEPRGMPMHDARTSFINAVLRVTDTRAAS